LMAAVDVVFVNYYPYWEGVPVQYAVATIEAWHNQVTAAAGAKRVIVSETGWPSCGNTIGAAVPSPENQRFFALNVLSWARGRQVETFYFEAFDEAWKVVHEGPQGACWGVWDTQGALKPGMDDVLAGVTIADNWSGTDLVDGPGQPSLVFTSVHLREARVGRGGDDDERLARRVVDPVVGGRGHRQSHAGDMGLRQRARAVIHAHVPIDVQEPHRGPPLGHPPARQGAPELGRAAHAREPAELAAQRLEFGRAVEPEEPAEIVGCVFLQAPPAA
jgi:hypothetical protein